MKAQAYAKADDSNNAYYANQKKNLEINPRHPIIKELLTRVKAEEDEDEEYKSQTIDMANTLIDTFRLRSGYTLTDSVSFSQRMERMLRISMGVDESAQVEKEPEYAPDVEEEEEEEEEETDADEEDEETETKATEEKTESEEV